jgi:hypothetical protein
MYLAELSVDQKQQEEHLEEEEDPGEHILSERHMGEEIRRGGRVLVCVCGCHQMKKKILTKRAGSIKSL